MKIVFESSNGASSLFELEHLKSICRQESKLIRQHEAFLSGCFMKTVSGPVTEECCPTWSLGYAVALLNNKTFCENITQIDVGRAKDILIPCSEFYISGALTECLNSKDSCADIPKDCTTNGIVHTIFHYLTPVQFASNLNNGNDALTYTVSFSPFITCVFQSCQERVEIIYKDSFQDTKCTDDSITKIVALDFTLKSKIFSDLLISDFFYLALGTLLVFVIIWVYTRSLLITFGSILNMIFSVTFAYFFYSVVFNVPFFPFANFASLILILGIGADDTFVFVDLWRAAQIKYGTLPEKRVLVLEDSTRHALKTLFVTSFTTSSALYVTTLSNIIAIKCFAVFAGTVVGANYLYTVTWLPCMMVIHDKYFVIKERHQDGEKVNCWKRLICCLHNVDKYYKYLFIAPKFFFNVVLPKLITTLRSFWISIFLLMGVAGLVAIFYYPKLKLTEGSEIQLLSDKHPFEKYVKMYSPNLAFESSEGIHFNLAFVWGILPTTDTNSWDPSDFGSLELDPNFNFGSNDSQIWLAEFCKNIKLQSFFNEDQNNFCYIDEFQEWMRKPCSSFNGDPCCENLHFPFRTETFNYCVVKFMLNFCSRKQCFSYTPGLRFDRDNSIKAIYLNLESSVLLNYQFTPVDEFWRNVSSFMKEQMSRAPVGLRGGWAYSQVHAQLIFYDLQQGLTYSTTMTLLVSLTVAFAVLVLTTRNIYISIYAIVTITFIVFSTIGCLVVIGWELNIFESLTFTLAVGLAVDFTVHYGVAYIVAPFADRRKRVLFAIEVLGPSVAVASVSTLTAGAIMISAVVRIYAQIGMFLVIIIANSWMFSTFFFLSLCFVIGPNGEAGKLSVARFSDLLCYIRRLTKLAYAKIRRS